MHEFKEEGYYEIKSDLTKNLMFVTYWGHWKSPDEVPSFKEHMLQATQVFNGSFDALVVIDDIKPPSLKVQKLHREIGKIWIQNGLQRGAQIMPGSKLLQGMAINVLLKLSGLASKVDIKVFKSVEEGLKWLGK